MFNWELVLSQANDNCRNNRNWKRINYYFSEFLFHGYIYLWTCILILFTVVKFYKRITANHSFIDAGKTAGKRYLQRTSEEAIVEDMKIQCCSSLCLEKFTFSFVSKARRSFWEMVTMEQNARIDEHREHVSEEKCVVNGHLVCTQSWRIIHGVSRSRSVKLVYNLNWLSWTIL